MKASVEARTSLVLIAAITATAFLANPVQGWAATKEKPPSKAQTTDLRPAIKAMTLKEGSNVVHEKADVKIIADVKNGKIVSWAGTDGKGNPLPGQTVQKAVLTCQFCWIKTDPENGTKETVCYEISCNEDDRPPPVRSHN